MTQRTAWTLVMLVLSVGYVLAEIIFNATLVTNAGGANLTPETLHNIELFGRTMAGIGLTVVVGDALTSDRRVTGIQRKSLVFALVAIICWPAMFFGQRLLIDAMLVEPSAAEERQRAYFSQLLRSALANETVRIEGLDFDAGDADNPQVRTFLTLFGGMVYADDTLIERLEDQRAPILREYITQRAAGDFDEHWADYKRLRAKIVEKYRSYREGSREIADARDSIPKRQAKARQRVADEVHAGWNDYQALTRAHTARRRARAEEVAPVVYDYFEQINKDYCDDESCFRRARERYDEEMADLEIQNLPPKFWLIRKDVSAGENLGKTLMNAVMTSGVSAGLQLLDVASGGDGGWKDEKFEYTNAAGHYAERLKGPMADQFVEESGGYEPGIDTLSEFRSHEKTAERVRAELAKQGIRVSDDWRPTDHAALNKAVRHRVERESDKRWQQAMQERDLDPDFPPGLSFAEFQRRTEIQQRIREALGERYVDPTLVDWDKATFHERFLKPAIDREVKAALARLESSKQEFADGGAYADTGKKALRGVLVPPIAMILSLFFVLLTIFKLPARFRVLFSDKPMTPATRAQKRKKLGIKTGVCVAVLLVLLTGPMVLGSSDYAEDPDSPVGYLLKQVGSNAQPAVAYAMRWALYAQPMMLPIGNWLEDTLGVYSWFSRHDGPIAALDKAVMTRSDGKETVTTASTQITTADLNVRAEPTTDSPVVARLSEGDAVRVVEIVDVGPWVEIKLDGGIRYVHGRYLKSRNR